MCSKEAFSARQPIGTAQAPSQLVDAPCIPPRNPLPMKHHRAIPGARPAGPENRPNGRETWCGKYSREEPGAILSGGFRATGPGCIKARNPIPLPSRIHKMLGEPAKGEVRGRKRVSISGSEGGEISAEEVPRSSEESYRIPVDDHTNVLALHLKPVPEGSEGRTQCRGGGAP